MIGKVSRLRKYLVKQKLKLDDVHAGILLNTILSEGKYFPVTGSSINLHSIAAVINDMIINRRQSIIEFGAGLSTLCFARVIRQLSLPTTIVSVDDNEDWTQLMQERLADEGLEDQVQLIYAPLADCDHSKNSLKWYDEKIVSDKTTATPMYDLVLVDGPMAWKKQLELSRYPAVPFIKPLLADRFCIFLDDTHRIGEQQILRMWEQDLSLKAKKVNSNFSMLTKGDNFNPVV